MPSHTIKEREKKRKKDEKKRQQSIPINESIPINQTRVPLKRSQLQSRASPSDLAPSTTQTAFPNQTPAQNQTLAGASDLDKGTLPKEKAGDPLLEAPARGVLPNSVVVLPDGRTFVGLNVDDREAIEAQESEALIVGGAENLQKRAEETSLGEFQALSGSAELKAQIQSELTAALEPTPLQELVKDPKAEFDKAGLIIGGAALAGLAALALGPLVVLYAGKVASSAVVGKLGAVSKMNKTILALGLFAIGADKVFDFRGGEMEVFRDQITTVADVGERLAAAQRSGLNSILTIDLLAAMADEVASAESRIIELGVANAQYRVNAEYLNDLSIVRNARIALVRRILEVENSISTGVTTLDPEALMFHANELNSGGS